jgi:GT2 family glycosyltransferase
LREDPRMVCFVAVLIPARTLATVGLLDEEFVTYGYEDDSYCYRVRRAGLKIGIHDGCFVDHGSLKSTFRAGPQASGEMTSGREIFVKKWGSYPL